MKRFFLNSLLAVALVASSHAATLSYTNQVTASGNNTPFNLNLSKFNTGLGTLTGVTVTVSFLDLSGSFDISTPTATSVDFLSAAGDTILIQGTNNTLGFTGYTNSTTVTTTPGTNTTIPASSTTNFAVTPVNVLNNLSQSIGNTFWSAYQTAGSGNIVFSLKKNPIITVSGGSYNVDSTAFIADARMVVTYDYDPSVGVPEPSTAVAGALVVAVGLVVSARRRRARA